MVNDYFGFSAGAFAVAWELSGELIRRGHRVAFLCATERRDEAGRESLEGREVIRLYARTPFRLRPGLTIHRPGLVARAAAAATEFRPQVVHAHVVHLHFSFGLLARFDHLGWPVILSAHDTGIFCPTKYTCQPPDDPARPASFRDCLACQRFRFLPGRAWATRRLVNGHVRRVAAVSRSLAAILRANGVARVSVVHNGLDAAALAGQGWPAQRFLDHLGLSQDEGLILFGGRLQQEKGDEAALRALALIPKALKPRLVVAGRRELFGPRLKSLARELGVSTQVVLAGWLDRDQMLGAYRAARAVLVPSLYPDPFPTINLEATALARPVVGTRFGGTPEVVAEGETGFLVDPRRPEETAERLGRLLASPELAERMGRAGRARLEADFSLRAQAEAFEALYREPA